MRKSTKEEKEKFFITLVVVVPILIAVYIYSITHPSPGLNTSSRVVR